MSKHSTENSAAALTTLKSNQDLDELVQNAPGVVLLDFYADWCGPCKKQGAILHDLEQSAAAQNASIIKINVDQHQALAQQFKVGALPTLLLLKNGKVIETQRGLASRTIVNSLLSR